MTALADRTMLLARSLGRLALGAWRAELDQPLGQDEWSELTWYVGRERLEGLLVSAVADHAMPVTPEQEAEVAAMEVSLVRADRALSEVAGAVSLALAGQGIDHRLLKGLALARLDYDDPLWRSSGDVDLLVAPDDYGRAAGVLRSLGADVPPLDGQAKSFAAMLGLVEVDVHRRIAAGPVGHLARDGWFDGRRTVDLDGVEIPALDRERAFLHACLNTMCGDWYARPRALLDVALLISRPPLDLAVVRELTYRWEVGSVVRDALDAAAAQYPIAVGPLVRELADLPVRPVARLACAIDAQARRTYSTRLLAEAYLSSRTWRGRAAYVGETRTDRRTPFGLALSVSPLQAYQRYRRRSEHRDPRG